MTLAEAVALLTLLMQTVKGLTDHSAAQDKKIATLEGQVAAHDAQLKPFPKET